MWWLVNSLTGRCFGLVLVCIDSFRFRNLKCREIFRMKNVKSQNTPTNLRSDWMISCSWRRFYWDWRALRDDFTSELDFDSNHLNSLERVAFDWLLFSERSTFSQIKQFFFSSKSNGFLVIIFLMGAWDFEDMFCCVKKWNSNDLKFTMEKYE